MDKLKNAIILDEYKFGEPYQMKSGSYEASLKTYKLVDLGNKAWLVPTDGDPSKIHYDPKNPNSQGYANRELTFDLEDGTEYKCIGPWNSNSEDLFNSTGIDLRDNHMIQGIIALKREKHPDFPNQHMMHLYKDILYVDEEPKAGKYMRVDNLAQEFADKYKIDVFYQYRSSGGGCAGKKEPKNA